MRVNYARAARDSPPHFSSRLSSLSFISSLPLQSSTIYELSYRKKFDDRYIDKSRKLERHIFVVNAQGARKRESKRREGARDAENRQNERTKRRREEQSCRKRERERWGRGRERDNDTPRWLVRGMQITGGADVFEPASKPGRGARACVSPMVSVKYLVRARGMATPHAYSVRKRKREREKERETAFSSSSLLPCSSTTIGTFSATADLMPLYFLILLLVQ